MALPQAFLTSKWKYHYTVPEIHSPPFSTFLSAQEAGPANVFSFSLASSWLWPMGSPCRRPEKVKVFIPWLFPSETAFGWLGSRSLLLLLWSAPNNTPFPDADNHSLRVPGCQPLCFF